MPDLSMKAWLIRLRCDSPAHIGYADENDFEADHETRAEGIKAAVRAGWMFRRNGQTICPACRKR